MKKPGEAHNTKIDSVKFIKAWNGKVYPSSLEAHKVLAERFKTTEQYVARKVARYRNSGIPMYHYYKKTLVPDHIGGKCLELFNSLSKDDPLWKVLSQYPVKAKKVDEGEETEVDPEEEKKTRILEHERKAHLQIIKRLQTRKTGWEIIGELILEAMEKLPDIPPIPVNIAAAKFTQKEEHGLVLSDIHFGLDVSQKGSGGLGSYGTAEAINRLLRVEEGLINIGRVFKTPRHRLNLFLVGDIIENLILRESQLRTSDNTIVQQVIIGVDELCRIIVRLLSVYGEIHAYAVGGNHARFTKEVGRNDPTDSFDYLIYRWIADRLKNHTRFKINIAESWFMIVKRMGWKFGIDHGEDIQSHYSFPYYGGDRAFAKEQELFADEHGHGYHYKIVGHHHTFAVTHDGRMLWNGSLVGGSEYSLKRLKLRSMPSQTFFSIHPEWGITNFWPIMGVAPQDVGKPRIYE